MNGFAKEGIPGHHSAGKRRNEDYDGERENRAFLYGLRVKTERHAGCREEQHTRKQDQQDQRELMRIGDGKER